MTRTSIRVSILTALACGALAAPLAAQDRGPGHGPPPEALAACNAHVSGASCSFTGRGGEQLSGTCVSPSSRLPLACMPAGGPGRPGGRGPHGPPPPEALSACAGITVGDACVLDTPDGHTLEGTCRTTPDGTACMPAHGPRHGPTAS